MSGRKLKDYFPMIRTREQILQDIESDIVLKARFESFKEDRKKEFLDFCTGERGVKILYDSFFNAVMNPDIYPEPFPDRYIHRFAQQSDSGMRMSIPH